MTAARVVDWAAVAAEGAVGVILLVFAPTGPPAVLCALVLVAVAGWQLCRFAASYGPTQPAERALRSPGPARRRR